MEHVDLTVFIPCYNEEQNIISTVEKVSKAMSLCIDISYKILIINDCSSDDSLKLIQAYINIGNQNVVLENNEFNLGLGSSYFKAIQICNSEYFTYIPGDDVLELQDLHAIFSEAKTIDLIIPYFGLDDSRTKFRLLLSKAFTLGINVVSGLKINYYNGPVLAKTYLLKKNFPSLSGFSSQAEFLVKSIIEGARYKQIKINNKERVSGDSKALSVKNFALAGYCILRILLFRLRLI
jgi:glycosyltransferase involved in cell wall biosynthesis